MSCPHSDTARTLAPSPWVQRFAHLVNPGGAVLDLACGSGRHAHFFACRGYSVTAVDRDISRIRGNPNIRTICADLEGGGPWPFRGISFSGIVVTNYLHRPLFGPIVESLAPGGVLIAETFAIGHEEFGRPRHPDFLLRKNEYLSALAIPSGLTVVAYEFGYEEYPKPAVMQRLCAVLSEDTPVLGKGMP